MYWVRRLMVGVLALVVVAGVVWFVARKASGSGVNTAADTSPVSSSGVMTGVLASSSQPADTSGTATPSGSGSPSTSTKAGAPTTSSRPAGTAQSSTATTSKAATTTPVTTSATKTSPPATNTAPTSPATTGTTAKASTTTSHPPTTTSRPSTSKTTPPPPSTDAQGRLICADTAIKVVATTGAPSFPKGSQPILGLSVTNIGSATCMRDLSGPLQVFTVHTAAGARVWSTADCFPGTGTDVRQLAPGQTVTYHIKWSGTTSQPGCTGQRVPVPSGSYTLTAAVGTAVSKPAPFTITG